MSSGVEVVITDMTMRADVISTAHIFSVPHSFFSNIYLICSKLSAMLKISGRASWLHTSRYTSPRLRCSYSSSIDNSTILVQHHPAPQSGSIRVLLFDRPEARNALSKQLIADLRRHVDEIQAKGATGGIRALIIASNSDKAFCAGADLRERRNMSQDEFVKHTLMVNA